MSSASRIKKILGTVKNDSNARFDTTTVATSTSQEHSNIILTQENAELKRQVAELGLKNEKLKQTQLEFGKQLERLIADASRLKQTEIFQNIGVWSLAEAVQKEKKVLDEEAEGLPQLKSEKKDYAGPGPECTVCAGTAPSNPRLCDSCQIYNDARHPFYCEPAIIGRKTSEYDRRIVTLEDLQQQRNCMLCEMIALTVSYTFKDRLPSRLKIINGGPYSFQCSSAKNYLEVVGSGDRIRSIPMEVLKPQDGACAIRCVLFLIVSEQPDRHFDEGYFRYYYHDSQSIPPAEFLGPQLVLHYSDKARDLFRVHPWETSFFSVEKLLEQVHSCQGNHKGPCEGDVETKHPPGFRLIDVYRRCVVEISSSRLLPAYVALSYPWASQEHFPTLTTANVAEFECDDSLSQHNTPRVVWDAVTLCFQIGERYLWVDRLCILQDNKAARRAQILAMDAIYKNASITIVNAADPELSRGLPGVCGNRRPPSGDHHWWRNFYDMPHLITPNAEIVINKSLWNSRAWTFQERLLSRRCIFISEQQVYFVCADTTWEEEYGGYRSFPAITPLSKLSAEKAAADNVSHYYEYVEEYTSRGLTVHTDILNAFAGVSNVLSSQLDTTFYFGLPERYFLSALLWTHADLQERRSETTDFPTYSWAGWMGKAKYEWETNDRKKAAADFGTLVHFFIVDRDTGIRKLKVENKWFGAAAEVDSDANLPSMDTAIKGYLDQVWNRESTEFWRQMIQNPWTFSQMSFPNDRSLAVAAEIPGCLIWKTTTASLTFYYDAELMDDAWVSCSIRIRDRLAKDTLDPSPSFQNRLSETDVGRTFPMQASWLKKHINVDKLEHPCEVVVLCAALENLLRENFRRDFSWNDGQSGYLGGTRYSPWQLIVMLVERDTTEPLLCRRLALGTIEARCWRLCEPEWKTVVLI